MTRSILVPACGGTKDCVVRGFANADNVMNHLVVDWSGYCGTYGMGGPGFFGLKFVTGDWLILRIWGSLSWLHIGQRIMEGQASADNQAFNPMYCNMGGQKRFDHVTPALALPQTIDAFDFRNHSGHLMIGDVLIEIKADPKTRPCYPTGKLRQFSSNDDLKEGWIIASHPWVRV